MKRQATLSPEGDLCWAEAVWRRRARCFNPDCKCRSSAFYEPQAYPHRTYSPAVAVAAVLELLSVEGATPASVARQWHCDPRTLGRWMKWIGWLVEVAVLFKLCWLQDPTGLPPPRYQPRRKDLDRSGETTLPTWKGRTNLVGSLILLCEWLARLHRDQGVVLEWGPGLSSLLRHQFDRFRLVSLLTKTSPPMRTQALWAGG